MLTLPEQEEDELMESAVDEVRVGVEDEEDQPADEVRIFSKRTV